MFIVTAVLFLLPCLLLCASGYSYFRTEDQIPTPTWRMYCSEGALFLAICTTLLELLFFYSWFHNGGSPHGMSPAPGIWTYLAPISFWTFVASIVLTPFGKGKWRLYIPAWAVAIVSVAFFIFTLEMTLE